LEPPGHSIARRAYTITAIATDTAGNVSSTTIAFDLMIDTAAPAATIDPTVVGAITGTADGSGSAVDTVAVSVLDTSSNLYWDGNAFASASPVFNTAALNPTTANAATWSLAITAPERRTW